MAACLADTTLPEKFLALWATQIAMWAREFVETLGRELTADDLEPVNWVVIERAQRSTAVDYAAAQAAGWWSAGRIREPVGLPGG